MNKQSEARRLAASLDAHSISRHGQTRAAAELRRLDRVEVAFQEFLAKTQWVQETATVRELGRHRADILRLRINSLTYKCSVLHSALKDAVEALRHAQDSSGVNVNPTVIDNAVIALSKWENSL